MCNRIKIQASAECTTCRGRGFFSESHGNAMWGGETMVCDCVIDAAPQTPEAEAALDSGEFDVVPAVADEPDCPPWGDDE